MVNCGGVAEVLVDYAFGELEEQEREWVETHLRVCLACRAGVEHYRRLFRLTLHLPPVSLPTHFAHQVLTAVRRCSTPNEREDESGRSCAGP